MQQLDYYYASLRKPCVIDTERILKECEPYFDQMLEVGNNLVFKKQYANDIDVTYSDEKGKITQGSVPGYKVISLTYTPEVRNSGWGFNFLRKTMMNHTWYWRDGLEYTKSILDQMPFKKYYIVKLLFLPAGGHGVIHTDTSEFTSHSVSLELKNADCSLEIYHNGQTHRPQSDYFIFDDTVLHGAGSVQSDRILFRIHGELDLDRLKTDVIEDSVLKF